MSTIINAPITIGATTISAPISLGAVGATGKSQYQSYLDTTDDDPVLSEEAWSSATEGGGAGSSITTATPSNLTGFIAANGTLVSGATAGASAATANTLVLRGASGEAAFGPLSATTLSATGTATLPHIHGSIAGNLYLHVRNTSGGPLTRGTPVYITGNVGNTDRVTVSAADSTNPAKMPAVALLDQTLANNGDGDGIIVGELDAANTNAFLLNQELFVGVGALTGTKPTTGEIQSVGVVSRVNPNTGVIVTNLQGRHPQYASLAGANTFTSASNSFTQPLYLNSAILGTVTTPIAGAYNGNGSGLTGDAQNLIVGYATLAGVAYSFAGTLPIASGGTGGATQPAAWTGLGGGGTIASPTFTGLTTSASTYANNATFTYNNAAAITNHRNALGLGTLQAVTFSGLTSNGFVDVAITSATSTRESVFRAKISDAGNDTFQISNGTITDGRFIPAFSGFVQSTNLRESLIFYGLVTAANDVTSSSAAGAINLLGARTNSTSDPINGTLTSLVNRRVLTIAHNAASAVDLDFSMICEAGGAVKFPSLQPVTILGRTNTTGGLVLGSFTVAAFPSTTYLMAVVTDALAPVVGAAVAAGGSAKCIVCYNGTSKIVTALL